jgi:Uma2 family endonuclease
MSRSAGSTSAGIKLTYDDYVALPDDGKRYEILDGDLAVTPSPLVRHQRVLGNLYEAINAYVRHHDTGLLLLAPVDVILEESTVVVPDLVFVRKERLTIVTERAVEGSPDLLVEILSKGSIRRDRGVKMKLYARFEVPHYWIVDAQARTIEMHELAKRHYRVAATFRGDTGATSTLFPGLAIELSEVWV